ncbi:MAG: zf-HC2 domain-containing protein [Patescibacteria group bacterium]|nr:zf-HC2 domain-containing protein [Patescibacteria group bacterium]
MRCHSIQEKLDAYLAEEGRSLSDRERGRILDHLQTCEECRREASRRRSLYGLLAEADVPPVPEGFASRVAARAGGVSCEPIPGDGLPGRSERNTWRRLRRTAGLTAALAAGLGLGAFLGNGVWRDAAGRSQAETSQADPLWAAGVGRLVVDDDDSLARAYLDLTLGRDG